jgi:predicted phospho-2-dehydro-3-deoxyheptonate aldolase
MSGKDLRLKRLISPRDGRTVILPLDHGVSCGPIAGLERMDQAMQTGVRGGADALVLHKGMMHYLAGFKERVPGIFLHLSASTQLGPAFHTKVLVGTVEEAIRRGADGVSVHVNLGHAGEPEMLAQLGVLGDSCEAWHMPLLVMIYVCGADAATPVPDAAIAHAARVAAELGADIIKIPTPRDDAVIAQIAAGSPVPVVVAGGGKVQETRFFLQRLEKVLQAGIQGVAIGRNVFQHSHPQVLLRAICAMVHQSMTADDAMRQIALAVRVDPKSPQPPFTQGGR